jgi:hypothetical protein
MHFRLLQPYAEANQMLLISQIQVLADGQLCAVWAGLGQVCDRVCKLFRIEAETKFLRHLFALNAHHSVTPIVPQAASGILTRS